MSPEQQEQEQQTTTTYKLLDHNARCKNIQLHNKTYLLGFVTSYVWKIVLEFIAQHELLSYLFFKQSSLCTKIWETNEN